jgi:hypothetical protein
MEAERLIRLRWRLRGAWMWPTFAALTVVDAVVLHLLPFQGDKAGVVPSLLVAALFNLVAVAIAAPVAGAVLRRRRPDLPRLIANDYAGTALLLVVFAALLAGGIAHQAKVSSDESRLRAATAAGARFIGAHAPRPFRDNVAAVSTVTIEHGRTYRTCAPSLDGRRAWCVIVRTDGSTPRIRFAGNEPNSSFAPIKDLGDH